MSALEALIAYGYVRDEASGRMVNPARRTQEWIEAPDAPGYWYRWEPDGTMMPSGLKPESMHIEGLYHDKHPEHFDLRWPDETVEAVYAQAVRERDGG